MSVNAERMSPRILDDTRAALRMLDKEIGTSCLAEPIAASLSRHVRAAESALATSDPQKAGMHTDAFVAELGRTMGVEVSVRRAHDLATIAVLDVKRRIGEPSQNYREARVFAARLIALCLDADEFPDLPVRSPDASVKEAGRALEAAIRSFGLPVGPERRLLNAAAAMIEQGTGSSADPVRSLALMKDFAATVGLVGERHLTLTQMDLLMGIVIIGFAQAAAACFIPVTWPVQVGILIAAGVAIVGLAIYAGVKYFLSSDKAAAAFKKIRDRIKTAANEDEVKKIVDEEAKDLDAKERESLKKNLEKALGEPGLDTDGVVKVDQAAKAVK